MSFLDQFLRTPATTGFRLINRRTGQVLAAQVEAALDSKSRRRGLLGLDRFPAGRALIIAPTNAIHTWFMRFAIDVIFVARDGRVVKVRQQLKPWRLSGALRGFAVIELPGGTLVSAQTVTNDVLSLEVSSSSVGTNSPIP